MVLANIQIILENVNYWNLNRNLDNPTVKFNVKSLPYVFFKYKFVNQKRKQNFVLVQQLQMVLKSTCRDR